MVGVPNMSLTCVFALAILFLNAAKALDQVPLGGQIPLDGQLDIAKKPNVVFILTDDQDLHMDSLSYMPFLQKHLLEQGTFYQRHFCTIALCCPSRVSLLTGKAAHNTNVTDVNPPYGGYPKFISQGLNDAWLPVWLQEAGYNTYYTGKLFNSHNLDNYHSPYPRGFNGSDFLLDPHTYQYLNATFQRNRDPPVSYEGDYSTDVLASKAFGFLDDAVAAHAPFFLGIAPVAPHSNVAFGKDHPLEGIQTTPPVPAKRHEHLFKDVPSGVSWVSTLPQHNQTNIDSNDHFYRNRLRALQAVDELVDELVARLGSYGILDNTYIIYSADNGYHIGQHRLQPGKECGFEEDINVPLIIRGPGVPKGEVTDVVTSHTDLAPTFMNIVGGKLRDDFDGASIPITASTIKEAELRRHENVNIEYWGFALFEGEFDHTFYWNNTYKGLRLIGKGYNLYYSVWCSGEHELYDLNSDPYQLHNLYPLSHSQTSLTFTNPDTTLPVSVPLSVLIPRLDSLVLVVKTCKSHACTHPWEVLHPKGDVKDLYDALNPKFDDFYTLEQERVQFSKCEKGYILESEGPSDVKAFGESGGKEEGWEIWKYMS